ncbi:MAG: hypothetical protein HC914_02095 [Chloroflexaceae bacterium]|nr:hypothetical protein [Chloroflexaceae bacterium]
MHTLFPKAADRTVVVCDWLVEPEEIAKPDFDPTDAVALCDLVHRPDWEASELTQHGMTSRAYQQGGVFVRVSATAFNDFVLERLA